MHPPEQRTRACHEDPKDDSQDEEQMQAQDEDFRAADDLESVECVHIRIQRTGSHSTIQGYRETGGFPRSAVLAVALA